MNYKPGYFKGKKVTIIGLGLLGRGVGDAKFLAEEGASLIVTDLKTKDELKESVEALKDFPDIQFVLGEHRFEDFQNRDFILKAAGVTLDSQYIIEARKNGIPIEMSSAIFAALTPAMIVGVTGTRGKSTVTHLLNEVLKTAGLPVFLGGNIKGVSTLPFLRETKEGDIAVLELDSWQLQGFGEKKISPHIALFTSFLPDHMNYYKGDMNMYLEDKANIFKFQNDKDILIMGNQVAGLLEDKYNKIIKAQQIVCDPNNVPNGWKIKIPGAHNRYNISLVIEAAKLFNIDMGLMQATIESFKGVPGRLELIRELNGIKIFNDTTATTPDATIAGIRALGMNKNTVVIIGGADKNLDITKLINELGVYAKSVVILPGTGSERFEKEFVNIFDIGIQKAETLEQAVKIAYKLCKPGDNLLFSPGFASFGMFKNEFDRGDQFTTIAVSLA